MNSRSSAPRRSVIAVFVVVGVVAGCGDDTPAAVPTVTSAGPTSTSPTSTSPTSTGPTSTSPTSTPATRPTGSTTVPPSSVTTTVGIPTDPASYAAAFVEAWIAGDRGRAATLAATEAIDVLFARQPGADAWVPGGCEGAAGSSYCTFTDGAGGVIVVRVGNEKASQGAPGAIDEVRLEQ